MKPAMDLAKDSLKYQEFLKVNLKDPNLIEGFNKQTLYRARRTAIVLGSVLIIALLSVVYAFVQDTLAKEAQRKTEVLMKQYAQCDTELEKQKALAQESALITQEVTRMAEEQLKLCQAGR